MWQTLTMEFNPGLPNRKKEACVVRGQKGYVFPYIDWKIQIREKKKAKSK